MSLYSDKQDLRWWTFDNDKKASESLFAAFRKVERQDQARLEDIKRFTRIYENRDYGGMNPSTYTTRRGGHGLATINISKMVVDTVAAKIAKSRPHARFQTVAGNRSMRRKARLLERWVEAEQYEGGIDREGPSIFLDCAITGTGIFKHLRKGQRVVSERVWPGDLFVDATDAWEGHPCQMFQRSWVSRDKLIHDFKALEKPLRAATESTPYMNVGRDPLADQLEVVEAWYVEDGKGKHIMAVEGVEPLRFESYGRDFPFSFVFWTRPRRGFWGIGLVEELMPLHIDINKTMVQMQKNIQFGNYQLWLDVASKVKNQTLTNEPGATFTYRNKPPIGFAIEPLSQGLVTHFEGQFRRAFAQGGVSADSAIGQNTLGADASGKARREHHELETERFSLLAREWEWLWMDTAKQYVALGKEIYKRDKSYSVVAANDRNTIRQVSWAEVDLEKDSYVIRVAPVSALPSLPSAKLAHVQELQLMQIIGPEDAGRLLDWPDLEEFLALDRAMSDYLDKIIEQMLDEGKYTPPTPFQDHQLALKKAQAALLKAMDDGVPDKFQQHLRNFMAQTHQMMQRAQMAQQGMLNPAAAGVPPAPGPTGQSPMAVRPQDGTAVS